MVSYIRPYQEDEIESGCTGYSIGENFVTEDVYDSIVDTDIEKDFIFEYGMGRFGKPEIIGLRFAENTEK